MRRSLVLLRACMFLVLWLSAATGLCAERVMRMSDGSVLDFQKLINDMKSTDLLFIGEAHTELHHHNAQLRIIKALAASGRPIAIGLEMFRADSQPDLDQWVDGGLSVGQFVEVYNRNWGLPWPW